MTEADEPEWITVAQAGELLGLRPHTVYDLIYAGKLVAEVTRSPGPERKRQVRLQRSAVIDLIGRSRVTPGELRHLHRPTT